MRKQHIIALTLAAVSAAPTETFIEAPGPVGPLRGTMLAPGRGQAHSEEVRAEHGPVLLIIPGSGPTNRDGNSPLGVRASTYRLLAEGLASRGITTIRIDKRGLFGSAAATPDPNAITIADYVADVQAWTTAIRRLTGVSCVWLLGHSEGALVAMAAARAQQGICGLILVSVAGRPMGEVLRDQLKSNPANAPLLDQALLAIDALEAGKRIDTMKMAPVLMPLFRPQVQGFLISAFGLDPVQLLKGYVKPLLILQGQRDSQIHEADALRLKQSNPKATLVLLPDVNHVLKTVTSDDPRANLATYADPRLPLAPDVTAVIGEFLSSDASAVR